MWHLYAPHHRVSREQFSARLDGPGALDRIHRFREGGVLVGFVGFREECFPVEGCDTTVMCMGLGFIVRTHRGRNLIQRAVVREIIGHWLRRSGVPLCFWTDALSYKPYLLIARNLTRYHPHRSRPDAGLAGLRDAIGARHYGAAYVDGVVRSPGWSMGKLSLIHI